MVCKFECFDINHRHHMRSAQRSGIMDVNLSALTQTAGQHFDMQLLNSTDVGSVVQPGDTACRHSCCERTPAD